jgi:hypothetical protein
MPFSHLLAMEVSKAWDIALLIAWFEQRKPKNQRKKQIITKSLRQRERQALAGLPLITRK